MSNDTQRAWTEDDAKDASRLLAELAKRSEKASGGLKRPEQIHESREVSGAAEKPRERANREAAQHPGAVVPVGQAGGGMVLKADNDNRRDRNTIEGTSVPVASASLFPMRVGE